MLLTIYVKLSRTLFTWHGMFCGKSFLSLWLVWLVFVFAKPNMTHWLFSRFKVFLVELVSVIGYFAGDSKSSCSRLGNGGPDNRWTFTYCQSYLIGWWVSLSRSWSSLVHGEPITCWNLQSNLQWQFEEGPCVLMLSWWSTRMIT